MISNYCNNFVTLYNETRIHMEKLKISKSVVPEQKMDQNEWFETFKAGSAYIKPTTYFSGNHFEPVSTHESIFNRILKFIEKIS